MRFNGEINALEIFQNTSNYLRNTESASSLFAKSIQVLSDQFLFGYLVPLSKMHFSNDRFISQLDPSLSPYKFGDSFEELSDHNAYLYLTDDLGMVFGFVEFSMSKTDSSNFVLNKFVKSSESSFFDCFQHLNEAFKWIELEFNASKLEINSFNFSDEELDFFRQLGFQNEPNCSSEIIELSLGSQELSSTPILTAGPSIGSQERDYVLSAVTKGWNNNHSDYLNSFQKEFAERIGVKHALATSSCTGALHLALLAAGIGPGDEVIVPEISWVATASAIMYVGATPVFAEINRQSWTLEPSEIQKLVTSNTKAIIPVHLYGFPAAMKEIQTIADDLNLVVIEDAAPAIGALVQGTPVGSFGDFGCFSFQGAKMLVTGEGGMLVTNNDELAAKAIQFQEHGRKPGTFWIEKLGYKYKMSNIQAALGLGQLERADVQIERKKRIRFWYEQELSDIQGISFQEELEQTRSIDWMTSISVKGMTEQQREIFMQELKALGIDSRPVFPTMSSFPIWGKTLGESLIKPVANEISVSSINLPSGVKLTRGEVSRVGSAVRLVHQKMKDK